MNKLPKHLMESQASYNTPLSAERLGVGMSGPMIPEYVPKEAMYDEKRENCSSMEESYDYQTLRTIRYSMATPKISDRKEPCYNEKKEKELQMSLVGIMKNRNGVVAFGDQFSSYQVGENMYQKKLVKKVFQGGDFLFVIAGLNEVFTEKGTVPIEEIIGKLEPEKHRGYHGFVKHLQEELGKLKTKQEYNLIISYPNEYSYNDKIYKDYGIMDCFVSQDDIRYTFYGNSSCFYKGDISVLPRLVTVREDWSLEEMEDYARHLVKDSIYYSEKLYRENATIGGKAVIISMV